MLDLRRTETAALCAAFELEPVLDPSNLDPAFRRNRVRHEVLPLLESGALRVPVADTFPLNEASAAYDRFVAGGKLGKIVLTI